MNGLTRCLVHAWALALLLLAAASPAQADSFGHGLLWKIEGAGTPPSYLFGTIHAEDARVLALPRQVESAFAGARSFTMEVVLDPMAIVELTTAMMLEEGKTLRGLIGESRFREVEQAMSARGMPGAVVDTLKPWAVFATLSTPKPATGLFLDRVLYLEAVSGGKPVHGLETAAEQMGVFDGLSLRDQIALLDDTLDNLHRIDDLNRQLIDTYLQRDLAGLMALNERHAREGDPRLAALLTERLIVARNHRMAERMIPQLKEGGAFVAVGALHLPGEEGILRLLSRRGYRLTAVY